MREWIVHTEDRRLTPDRYVGSDPRIRPIEALIYHYSVTAPGVRAAAWLTRRDAHYVSAHFTVDRRGHVLQLAPLTDRTFHAGGPTSSLFGSDNVNGRTWGVELENLGPLRPAKEGLVDAYGRVVAPSVPVFRADDGGLWEAFPEAQIAGLERLVAQLIGEAQALEDPHRHLGHCDVDPSRKVDPGPAFPWSRIRAGVTALVAAPRYPRGCRLEG